MGLSKVKINIENGALGGRITLDDGVTGIIATATVVPSKLALGTAYAVTSLKDATEMLGISEAGTNAHLYSIVRDYYQTLNASTTLYLLPVAQTVSMSDMLDDTKGYVAKLQAKAQGKIRIIGVSRLNAGTVTASSGLDADVDKALIKGQAAAEKYRDKMRPFVFVVDAKNYNGKATELKDYNTASYRAGSVFLCNERGQKNNRIGLMLGAVSVLPTQRKISRVKNGPLPITSTPYIGTNSVDDSHESWEMLHDKGYVFLRTFTGKSGYYFSSDRTTTSTTDDYSSLSKNRVINKALIITYNVYVEELNNEVTLTSEGKLPPAMIAAYQSLIEGAIETNMGDAISNVRAIIDPDQNLATSGTFDLSLRIVPVGYLEEIVVSLGFESGDN